MNSPARAVLAASLLVAVFFADAHEAFARKKKKTLLDSAVSKVSEALVSAPRDNETCFSPDEPCGAKLVKFVASASKSIDMAIFDFNLDELAHVLLTKSRELPVRVVVDARQAKGDHSLVATLIKGGVDVRVGRQRGIMHNKFTVIDGARVELGSFNYTNHAAEANNENQLYLGVPEIVGRYHARFEQIWGAAKPSSSLRGLAHD